SKSYTVEQTLKKLGKPFKLSNTRITAKGLFELLRAFPDDIHVLEDVETLFADKNSFNVLRSALWGQEGAGGGQDRRVDWYIAGHPEEFIFTGGIILIANCRLDDVPQARALKTRIVAVHHQPTNEEIAALMRRIARQGHRHGPHRRPPEECLEVAQEIIARSQRLERNLDIRLFVNGGQDRLQWKDGASVAPWVELLESRLKERALPSRRAGPSNDSARAFLTEHYAPDSQAGPLPTSDVYATYQAWCAAKGVPPVSPAAFGRQVRQAF